MDSLEQQIEGVVDAILEDYRHQRQIDKMDILIENAIKTAMSRY